MNSFACIDIGGTAIKSGLVLADGTILSQKETPTKAREGGKALAAKVRALCQEILLKHPECQGIAISSAGVVDSDRCEIIHATGTIPGYIGINFKDELQELGLPVEMENDVNCAGLAESSHGAGAAAKSMLMLTIGTGVGGCFIEEGRLLNGHTYSACEVGYLPMQGGTLESLGSTTALVKDVAARKNEPVENWNGRKIFAGALEGDEDCLNAIDALCETLGAGLATLCFILNPEVIVLGGGIMSQKATLQPRIQESFERHSVPLIANNTRLDFAFAGNTAGMKGALVHFLNRHPELNA